MSKLTDFYSQLAASVGMRYDSENNVIYGQKEGFELVVYAADGRPNARIMYFSLNVYLF